MTQDLNAMSAPAEGAPIRDTANAENKIGVKIYPAEGDYTTGADGKGKVCLNNDSGLAISPDEARKAQRTLAAYLPDSIGEKLNRFLAHELTEHISKGGEAAPGLEGLLPLLKTIKSADILQTEYPPISWLLSDYLSPGLTFLYGKPKVGKSWLALQLALSVLVGGKMLGRDVPRGRVLYLALEDNERRLQNRMKAQMWPITDSVDVMLFDRFREQIGALNSAGGRRLLAYIEAQKYTLVIVDTFSRAMMGDQLKSDEMTAAVGPIQQYAMKTDLSLVIVDHEPKNGDSLFGSVAKVGVADTFWRLYKEQGKAGAKLNIWGRDLEDDYTLQMEFDHERCYWHCSGDAYQIELTERRQEILDALEMLGRSQLGEIAEAVGQDRGNTFRRLQDLANEGLITRQIVGSKVFFNLPSDASKSVSPKEP